MAISHTDVLAAYSELSAATNSQIDAAITRAYARLPADIWGGFRDEGALYLSSHMVAIGLPGQGGLLASSQRLGPAAINWATSQQGLGEDPLAATKYGREFIALRDILPGARLAIATAVCP